MKSIFPHVPWPVAVAAYCDDTSLTLSAVARTPLGPRELFSGSLGPGEHLEDLINASSFLRRARRSGIVLSVTTARIFHSTRPLQTGVSAYRPHQLLREALSTDQSLAGNMAVDVVRCQPAERAIVSLAASEQRFIADLTNRFAQVGVRVTCIEPAACALLRMGAVQAPAPRRSQLVLRVFLGESEGLGMLVSSDVPLLWRKFQLCRGNEGSAILSIARSLEPMAKYCGVDRSYDQVIVHGRADLHPLLSPDWLEDQIGTRVTWVARPSFTPKDIAFATANDVASPGDFRFNLVKHANRGTTLSSSIPWAHCFFHAAFLGCMAVLQFGRAYDLSTTLSVEKAHDHRHLPLRDRSIEELRKEKADLELRLKTIDRFTSDRILWHQELRAIAGNLPDHIHLTSCQAWNEVERTSKKVGKPKKSLVFEGSALCSRDVDASHDIEEFVHSLHGIPSLTRKFPTVEMGPMQRSEDANDRPINKFAVTLKPKGPGDQPRPPTPGTTASSK